MYNVFRCEVKEKSRLSTMWWSGEFARKPPSRESFCVACLGSVFCFDSEAATSTNRGNSHGSSGRELRPRAVSKLRLCQPLSEYQR